MAAYHNHHTDIQQQDVDDELGIEHLCMAATSALLLSTPKQKEEMISYTCMLLASSASQQQTQTSSYSLQLIYDTEEHLFFRDGKHLYIWATPGSYTATDIQFFTALRLYFLHQKHNNNNDIKPLHNLQIQIIGASSTRTKDYNGLPSSTFFTNVLMDFEFLFEGKIQKQAMLFHRYDHDTLKTLLLIS
jgi:hypothetical protein